MDILQHCPICDAELVITKENCWRVYCTECRIVNFAVPKAKTAYERMIEDKEEHAVAYFNKHLSHSLAVGRKRRGEKA